MKRKQLTSLQFLVQGLGVIFIGTFLSAYLFSLTTNSVLHAEPVYHEVIAIFGGLFVALVVALLVFSATSKLKE